MAAGLVRSERGVPPTTYRTPGTGYGVRARGPGPQPTSLAARRPPAAARLHARTRSRPQSAAGQVQVGQSGSGSLAAGRNPLLPPACIPLVRSKRTCTRTQTPNVRTKVAFR